ncbi:polyprenyl synthetase family protein [Saccharopolyspora phatthalungensis]|uniref:Geranylgeranyl diphosphate synthase type II n=1 Tax=Saccharopolyspora phatthalungensis TaxID=664693 RepID=A0A840Q6M7_9PSEU|nr:farnesyl diphosphate synthase [Saccharopolyspora phatthalungensis]MBB5155617.1 geranylgeranyl diphosphate synthase type II [Saccharopolyspora phatthalungensis]
MGTVAEFDLSAYLISKAALITAELEQAVPVGYPTTVFESMRYSLLSGGKRLRPALCLASCDIVGGDPSAAMPTACGLEMLHTASLIHDDLPAMDNDDYRRGKPSNHKVFGDGIAVLTGDALWSYALEFILLNTRQVPAERLLRVLHTLINRVGVDGLVGGQVVDIQHEGIEEIDLPTVDYIHAHKTGSMIDAAVVTGAIIGGASEDVIARMSRYARKIGIAFQIIDDVLDGTASQQQLGKTPNKDERAHKATYPRLVGIAESTRRARELVDSAKKELDSFGDRATLLLAIADHICTRKS